MNKKNMFLAGLLAISAMQTALPTETVVFTISTTQNTPVAEVAQKEPSTKKGWGNLCKTYATSLISGGLIGAITGKLSAYASNAVKNDLIVIIAIFIVEPNLRFSLINDINQSFEDNEIQHKKNLVRDTAWLASWIAFLA